MAPKKRKDLHEGSEAAASAADDIAGASQGQAQPPEVPRLTSESFQGDEDTGEHQEPNQKGNSSLADTIRNINKSDNDDSIAAASQVGTEAPEKDLHELSVEELELEFQIMSRQNRIDLIRQTILQKKRQNNQNIRNIPVPQVPVLDPPVRQAPVNQPIRESALPDSESVLRERQNDRLRRAGLLPPRASEARQQPRASAPAPGRMSFPTQTIRHQSVPMTSILYGVDRKISEIMNSTGQDDDDLPGDKSELTRAGIKMTSPEKWKGDRSLQLFTDWVHSVAHYFKVHAPLSERLKVNLIGGYLLADPLDWYWRHVAPHAKSWTATDVMVALRRNFLVDELSRQAADKFESADQGSKDIHAFQAYILKLADQMTEYPSPVALNRRLLKGMKSNLSAAIIANRGIDAELSPWEDIVQAAMDQERAQRYAGSMTKAAPTRTEDRKDTPRTSRLNQPNRPSNGQGFNRPKGSAPVYRPMVPVNRPSAASPIRNTAAPAMRPTGAKPTDQCRTCGAFGHWSPD
ncbi:hypothetical protein CF328_g9106, partial [Tilletia controversa]